MWPKNIGNWVPYNGIMDNSTWMPSNTILNYIGEVKAKHILIIHDCCYSGGFATGHEKLSGLNLADDELDEKSSRIIFTSGDMTKVKDGAPGDGSPFSRKLCEYLEDNDRPTLRVSKLINAVTRRTANISPQVPQAREIKSADNESVGSAGRRSENGFGSISFTYRA